MTFNLRYASEQPPNRWSDRRPVLKNTILESDPDLIGTQEGLYRQLRDVAEDLPTYDWIGEGREGGSAGEFMAIFYKRDRLDPLAYGHLWLSDTPRLVGSRSWGNNLPRMATWVLFKERKTEAEFYHWNTHFDHQSEPARRKSAEFLIEQIRAKTPARPLVLTGDFNQSQQSVVYQTLLDGAPDALKLADSWEIAKKREGDGLATFNGFKGPQNSGQRIDWILVTPEFSSLRSAIILHQERDQWPSDHFPVMSDLVLKY